MEESVIAEHYWCVLTSKPDGRLWGQVREKQGICSGLDTYSRRIRLEKGKGQ